MVKWLYIKIYQICPERQSQTLSQSVCHMQKTDRSGQAKPSDGIRADNPHFDKVRKCFRINKHSLTGVLRKCKSKASGNHKNSGEP